MPGALSRCRSSQFDRLAPVRARSTSDAATRAWTPTNRPGIHELCPGPSSRLSMRVADCRRGRRSIAILVDVQHWLARRREGLHRPIPRPTRRSPRVQCHWVGERRRCLPRSDRRWRARGRGHELPGREMGQAVRCSAAPYCHYGGQPSCRSEGGPVSALAAKADFWQLRWIRRLECRKIPVCSKCKRLQSASSRIFGSNFAASGRLTRFRIMTSTSNAFSNASRDARLKVLPKAHLPRVSLLKRVKSLVDP